MRARVQALLRSRSHLPHRPAPLRKAAAEGGCGVIGMASGEKIAGGHLRQALIQMRNRGNGKGGGVAIAGLDPGQMGVSQEILNECYLLTVAYLDPTAIDEVEAAHIQPALNVEERVSFRPVALEALETPAPEVVGYFVRVKKEALDQFARTHGLGAIPAQAREDEFIYQNSFRLNTSFYASLGEKRAFVLSHGKDLLVFKLVSYGEEVMEAYKLEDLRAHVWIGHHRYPTKGRVWHPGGAHPFVGLHEALVHNGDFANYASVCEYLSQHNVYPLYLTDTEVSVLMFDLLRRTFGYSLEHTIEAMAPTTERDFTLLPPEKQEIYRQLGATHMHGSPDGPWFFLIAQTERGAQGQRDPSLIGITDTSMLRPQVFALQDGGPSGPAIGFAASEKQAIDAALRSLSAEDRRFWPRADRYWNARGGSHTDGGAFSFRVVKGGDGQTSLICSDKFGRRIQVGRGGAPFQPAENLFEPTSKGGLDSQVSAREFLQAFLARLPDATYEQVVGDLQDMVHAIEVDANRERALLCLSKLIDGRYATGALRRSSLLCIYDLALEAWVEAIRKRPSPGFQLHQQGDGSPRLEHAGQVMVVDASGFEAEGPNSLARELVDLARVGFQHLIVVNVRGQRFIGNGLGANTDGLTIEVFGSPGDYLGSGMDGLRLIVHAHAQDQVAQIMKAGELVIHGDVGQTFMYGAKGGRAFVLGSAAGRPLINAVGKPQVVINGTCLDYLAESFMAGDPLDGGGFVVLNGMRAQEDGTWGSWDTPYPGGNLFSLASGGAIYIRDPHQRVGEDQLNGGQFSDLTPAHWDLILPLLEANARHFDLPVSRLLRVDGQACPPDQVYRLILPVTSEALRPEAAWVQGRDQG